MNSCVVSGLIGEAEYRQISGYMHRPNKEKWQVVPDFKTMTDKRQTRPLLREGA
jgi:hypothetical protein